MLMLMMMKKKMMVKTRRYRVKGPAEDSKRRSRDRERDGGSVERGNRREDTGLGRWAISPDCRLCIGRH